MSRAWLASKRPAARSRRSARAAPPRRSQCSAASLALSSAAPAQRSALLSQGISEAMWNTALGLGIAVFCMIFHLILHTWSKKIKHDMEQATMKLENLLLLKQR